MSDSGHRDLRSTRRIRALRSVALIPLVYLAANAACSSGSRPREVGNVPDVTGGGRPDAGLEPNVPHTNLGDAGTTDPDGGGLNGDGGPGSLEPPSCGNGAIDPGEDCDPVLASGESCVLRGFDSGLLGCDAQCRFTTDQCAGVEGCSDGRDNDGDGSADCADVDCAVPCADACFAPQVVAENSTIYGTTSGHGAALAASCGDGTTGREVVYQVTVSQDGKFDVLLSSDQALTVSLRESCYDDGSELLCGGPTRLTLDALAGDTYFVVVDGASSADAGEYMLEVIARQQACGDGIRDTGEECDDGNINDGDGCDPDCFLELSESEPNNFRFNSDTYDFSPWFGQMDEEGDADTLRVTLTDESATLVVRTQNLGDGACGFNLMDTTLEIFDTNANDNVLLVSDDDGGDGLCSLAVAPGLPAGTYFVRVKAAPGASPATFPYRLDLAVAPCGDGVVSFGEECDDENLINNDGCDAACRQEAQ